MKTVHVNLPRAFLLWGSCLLTFLGNAWDVEHDVVMQLVGEHLPSEIAARMSFSDFGIMMANCHYPDWIEGVEPGRFRTCEELAADVGCEDAAILREQGFRDAGWFHSERGRGMLLALLAKSFKSENFSRAAFYMASLQHVVADVSALNHTPIANYCHAENRGKGALRTRKVEPGAKNIFGFRSDGAVVRLVRERLKGFVPKCPADDFSASRDAFVVDAIRQADLAAVQERAILFGPLADAQSSLADLVAMQVRVIEDMIWTAWAFRDSYSFPDEGFSDRVAVQQDSVARKIDPARQGVFAEVFDPSLDPHESVATVVVVCEPYSRAMQGPELSYVAKIDTLFAVREMRRRGFAVKGVSLYRLEDEGTLPNPQTEDYLYLPRNGKTLSGKGEAAVATFLKGGGRMWK